MSIIDSVVASIAISSVFFNDLINMNMVRFVADVLVNGLDKEHQRDTDTSSYQHDFHNERLVRKKFSLSSFRILLLSKTEAHIDHGSDDGWWSSVFHLTEIGKPLNNDKDVHESEEY